MVRKTGTKELGKLGFFQLILVVFLAWTSLGAWWQLGNDKNIESGNDKKQTSQPVPITLKPNAELKPAQPAMQKSEGQTQNAVPGSPRPAGKAVSEVNDVKKIQEELRQVIKQTNRLQGSVRKNRTEVQEIINRARIHDRILRSISIPTPVRSVQQIDTQEILRREKVRLIAEQTKRSQEQLRALQLNRPSTHAGQPAASTKTSEIS